MHVSEMLDESDAESEDIGIDDHLDIFSSDDEGRVDCGTSTGADASGVPRDAAAWDAIGATGDDVSGDEDSVLSPSVPGGASHGVDAGNDGDQPPSLSIPGGADDTAGGGVSAGEAQQAPEWRYPAGDCQTREYRDMVAHVAAGAVASGATEPTSYNEACDSPQAAEWMQAMQAEYEHGDALLEWHKTLLEGVLRYMPDVIGMGKIYDTGWPGDGLLGDTTRDGVVII
jgi:hypothetical protein